MAYQPAEAITASSASTLRGGEPALHDAPGQRRVADSAVFRQLLKSLQIVLVKPQSDLLGARRSNLDVEILEFVMKFFDALTTPELALGAIAFETRKLALFVNHSHLPLPRRQAR